MRKISAIWTLVKGLLNKLTSKKSELFGSFKSITVTIGSTFVSEIAAIQNSIYNGADFFIASPKVLAKHFLKHFVAGEINFLSFAEIRKQLVDNGETGLPEQENDFYEFICRTYLEIEKPPHISLVQFYDQAAKDISEIDARISSYQIKLNDPDNDENSYERRLWAYYIQLNQKAKSEIIYFLTSKKIYDFAWRDCIAKESIINSIYLRIPYRYCLGKKKYDVDFLSDISNKMGELPIAVRASLEASFKSEDQTLFYEAARKYIEDNLVVVEIESHVANNHRLNGRKRIFEELIKVYNQGDKYIFCSVAPLQIEGLFYDYSLELGVEESSLRNATLGDKLQLIIARNPGYRSYEYYMFRFPMIRNEVAHGQILNKNIDWLADYLLLDLLDLCRLLVSNSLSVNRAVSIIKIAHKSREDYKALLRYCLYKEVSIPVFYNLTTELLELNEAIIQKEFWDFLRELADARQKIEMRRGILLIVTSLKKSAINETWCKELITDLSVVSKQEFDEETFLEQLNDFKSLN
jgi:hypothetical protein